MLQDDFIDGFRQSSYEHRLLCEIQSNIFNYCTIMEKKHSIVYTSHDKQQRLLTNRLAQWLHYCFSH